MEPQPVLPPPPAPPPPPRWGLGDFLIGVFGGYALASLVASLWSSLSGDDTLSLAGQAFSQIGLWTGMVGAALVASHRKGAGTLREDFGFRGKWSDIGVGLAVAVSVQLLVLPGIAYLLRPLLGEPEVSGPVQDLLDKSKGPAFAGQTVAFGVAHLSTLPVDAVLLVMISLTVFGAILAAMALRTGRLGPGIVTHAVFNLFTLLYLTFTR